MIQSAVLKRSSDEGSNKGSHKSDGIASLPSVRAYVSEDVDMNDTSREQDSFKSVGRNKDSDTLKKHTEGQSSLSIGSEMLVEMQKGLSSSNSAEEVPKVTS